MAELDTAVEPGLSSSIDHDSDIFYLKLKSALGDESTKHAAIFDVAGKKYAGKMGEGTYTKILWGSGSNRTAAHQSDFDFEEDGGAWKPVTAPVEVAGKTVKMEVRKYAADVSAESLATDGEGVFGPQEMDCSASQAFSASEAARSRPKRVASKPKGKK